MNAVGSPKVKRSVGTRAADLIALGRILGEDESPVEDGEDQSGNFHFSLFFWPLQSRANSHHQSNSLPKFTNFASPFFSFALRLFTPCNVRLMTESDLVMIHCFYNFKSFQLASLGSFSPFVRRVNLSQIFQPPIIRSRVISPAPRERTERAT
jgi:hypothetical protein